MTKQITLTLDGVVRTAEVPLGATLGQFLSASGVEGAPDLLSDGRRCLSAKLELAYRFEGIELSSEVAEHFVAETPALVTSDLLVLSQKS